MTYSFDQSRILVAGALAVIVTAFHIYQGRPGGWLGAIALGLFTAGLYLGWLYVFDRAKSR